MKVTTRNITLLAFLLAIGYVLPFLTLNNVELGRMLNLIHIPVFICGLLLGPYYGFILGLILPLIRSATLGVPTMPSCICVAIELSIYGLGSGILNNIIKYKYSYIKLIFILIVSMILGRIGWALTSSFVGNLHGKTILVAIISNISTGIIGIIIQLILLPPLIIRINKIYKIKK